MTLQPKSLVLDPSSVKDGQTITNTYGIMIILVWIPKNRIEIEPFNLEIV